MEEWLHIFINVVLCYTATVVIYTVYYRISSCNESRLERWPPKKVASILVTKLVLSLHHTFRVHPWVSDY